MIKIYYSKGSFTKHLYKDINPFIIKKQRPSSISFVQNILLCFIKPYPLLYNLYFYLGILGYFRPYFHPYVIFNQNSNLIILIPNNS